jgi:hypothetical protein
MTIDERLEKLTERHEALAQSVELLVVHGHETDRRLDTVAEGIAKLTERHEALAQSVESVAQEAESH